MDWMAYELAMIFSQWAQLYTDTQYATIKFEAFKQLNLAALHFDNTDWRDECKRADQAATPIQRVNPPCKATPNTTPARGYKRGRGNRNARSETPETHAAAANAGGSTARTAQRREDPRQASGARPGDMFAASAPQPRPSTVPGRMQGTTTVLAKPQRTAARRKASAGGIFPAACCNEVYCGTSVEVANVYSRTGCGEKPAVHNRCTRPYSIVNPLMDKRCIIGAPRQHSK